MKYLSLELSKKLAAKGLVSESDKRHVQFMDKSWAIKDEVTIFKLHRLRAIKQETHAAFTLSDIILNKDNAIKLWGEEKVDEFGKTREERSRSTLPGSWLWESFKWRFKLDGLLNIHHSGGDVEAALLKDLT